MDEQRKKELSGLKTKPYIRPECAWKTLREAEREGRTVYLRGMTSTGKTSLVVQFLQKKRFLYLSAPRLTAQQLNISGRASGREIVVIDDLQFIPGEKDGEELYTAIADLTERDDVWVILISRGRMPTWLRSSHLQEMFCVIDERLLTLTAAEVIDFFGSAFPDMTSAQLRQLAEQTRGMGMVLRACYLHLLNGEVYDDVFVHRVRMEIYDYLEYHVYESWELDLQDFCLQVSVVKAFDEELARMITGRNDVGRLIQRAQEVGSFLGERVRSDRSIEYCMNEGMRISMLRRMERLYSAEQRNSCYYNAGLYYETRDRIPEALEMYEACGQIERISRLLINNVRRHIGEGHYFALRRYYLALPEERVRQNLELMVGVSMLNAVMLNVDESERWYQELQKYSEDKHGGEKTECIRMLLYLDIALPQRGNATLEQIMKTAFGFMRQYNRDFPEFSLTSNQPSVLNGGKDVTFWCKYPRRVISTLTTPVEKVLGKFGKGLMTLGLAECELEQGADSYEISMLINRGKIQAQSGRKPEMEFVAVSLLAWVYVFHGQLDEAEEALRGMAEMVEDIENERLKENIRAMQLRMAFYRGDLNEINRWMEQAPNEEGEFCTLDRYLFLTKARGYLAQNRPMVAVPLLQQMEYYADVMNRDYIRIEGNILLAIATRRIGRDDWDTHLTAALDGAEPLRFTRVFSREAGAILPLLQETGWKGKKRPFWKQLLTETEQMAAFYPAYLQKEEEAISIGENARRILQLQAEGLSMAQIAEQLGISVENVKYHNRQTYRKLGVTGKTAAVLEAQRRKLI